MQISYQIGPTKLEIGKKLFVIAGPCVIESEAMCLEIAETLLQIQKRTQIPFIFKASFDKANRTSIQSFRGPGLEKGLEVLRKIQQTTGLPVLTDIHEPSQVCAAAEVVDCLQIPAFLCRQTNLLVACAKTQKPINVKKGQFVSPEEMENAVEKIRAAGGRQIFLTERGTFFGYNRLVNDMTAIGAMQNLGCPVIFDATHSTQRPGGLGKASAGRRDLAPVLARAAIAAGADGLFLEVHPNPQTALCDAECMLPLDQVESLVTLCQEIFRIVHQKQ